MKKKVLILGAGYGGTFAAAHLCKERDYCDITLIDQSSHMELIQQISYIVLGTKDAGDVTVRIDNLFRQEIGEGQLKFVEASVESIDLNNKTVRVSHSGKSSQDYKYDYLIIALGSETGYFGISGAKENTLPFRSVQDALEIRKNISSLEDNSTIIIGGGGPTGVSLAAALTESDMLHGKNVEIKIIDASESLLSGWDPRIIKTSEKVLVSKGIEVLTGKKIQEITSKSVVTESDDEIRSDCTIWTAGVKGRSIIIIPEIERTKSDTIPVDKHFELFGSDNVFAIGDICEFKPENDQDENGTKAPPPKLAQLAVRQARFVAENIIKKEKGESLNDEFRFFQRGHTISLGHKSIAILNGLLVTGNMCNYTEDTIIDNFVTEIKNREQGVSVKARAAAKDVAVATEKTDYPAAFDFVTYATSRAFMELVK